MLLPPPARFTPPARCALCSSLVQACLLRACRLLPPRPSGATLPTADSALREWPPRPFSSRLNLCTRQYDRTVQYYLAHRPMTPVSSHPGQILQVVESATIRPSVTTLPSTRTLHVCAFPRMLGSSAPALFVPLPRC
ncbi:hypothetical protein DFH06DRAFT_1338866 [Mycena polygramma]|nr:hypothetical protein DFH06DRAFT_1338866 [Mycena polygramma]